MMLPPPFLSVIVAAYNEAPVIARTVRLIVDELERHSWSWELIVVDDGSRDGTGEQLARACANDPRITVLHHRRNFGQGRALRSAFDVAAGEVLVTLDADLSYGPEYVARLVEALERENVEIALASPYAKGGEVRNVPFYRHILSRAGNWYLARMSSHSVSTITCVVRAMRREVIEALPLVSDGMELQLEILMKAAQCGFRVCEIPAKLEWAKEKKDSAGLGRVSKMRIVRTVRTYLMMGWLSRPAFLFVTLALLLIGSGLYMVANLAIRFVEALSHQTGVGWSLALTQAAQDVFNAYTYSVFFAFSLIVIGLQVLATSLLMQQNKFYFEHILSVSAGKRAGNWHLRREPLKETLPSS